MNLPPINRNALIHVKRSTSGSIPIGRGVVLVGSFSTDGFALITAPSGADARISGVTFETSPDNDNVGFMIQAGLSNVQLRIGVTAVSFGDLLRVQDATGVWEPAIPGSVNVYYYALQTVSAGSLCYAAPIANRSI